MFDWLLPEDHAISVLKKDHDDVQDLFDEFEKADTPAAKERIIDRAVTALKVHAVIEEEIFYPTVRSHVGAKVMDEADEEHHVAPVLIAELDANQSDRDHRHAKFTVLAESVRHHIREEENEMLPKAKELDIDFKALGQRMLDRKQELLTEGVVPDREHEMVGKAKGRADSPAAASRRKAPAPKSTSRRTAGAGATRASKSSRTTG